MTTPAPPASLPRRPFPVPSRRRRIVGTALVALLAVLVAGLVWWFSPYGERAGVGTAYAYDGSLPVRYEHEGTVVVPTARIDLAVGAPLDEVDEVDLSGADYEDPVALARGTSYLPVRWIVQAGPTDGLLLAPPQQFALHLRAGDLSFDLGSDTTEIASYGGVAPQGTSSVAVVVPDEALDGPLLVDVVYDGLTQTLDLRSGEVDAGAAAPFYDDAPTTVTPTTGCDLLDAPATAAGIELEQAECTVGSVRVTPYVGGLGWAETADAPWAVVDVDLAYGRFAERTDGGRSVVVRRTASEVTLDGMPAQVRSVYTDGYDNRLLRELVFVSDGAPDELRLQETAEFYDLPEVGVVPPEADRSELAGDLTLALGS